MVAKLDEEQTQDLPQLRHWSDLVWIAWSSIPHYPGEAAALKYIFKYDVVTPNTVAIIESVLGVEQGRFPDDGGKWPGTKFNSGEKEFFALLGTPHGMYIRFHLIIFRDFRAADVIISTLLSFIVLVVN